MGDEVCRDNSSEEDHGYKDKDSYGDESLPLVLPISLKSPPRLNFHLHGLAGLSRPTVQALDLEIGTAAIRIMSFRGSLADLLW